MTAQSLQNPLPTFTGLDAQPLSGGYVYFGLSDQDPEQYSKPVYWDEALTQVAAQPLRTTAGYIVHNGSPATVWIDGSCSIRVRDSQARQVYYEADWAGFVGAAAAAASAAATAAAAASAAAAAASATAAAAAEVNAEAAEDQAELYAAAAATGATFYDTIALGLAAVASGATFGVKAGGSDGLTRPTVYRDTAGVATLLYAVVPGSEFDSEVDRIDSIVGAEFQTIGRPGTPVTGTDNSDVTTVYLHPVTRDGQIKRVRAFLGASSTALHVKVFRPSGANLVQVTDTSIAAAAGLNDFDADLAEFTAIDALAGDYIGWYVTGGRMKFSAGADLSTQAAGNVTSLSPATFVNTAAYAIGFDIEAADHLTEVDVDDVDRRTQRLGSTLTQTIGRPSAATLVTGTNPTAATYVIAEEATEDGYIKTVRLFSLGTGNYEIRALDLVGTVFSGNGETLTLAAVPGLNTYSADAGDFTPLRIERGQRIGVWGGTRLAYITATSDSGGFYNGAGNSAGGSPTFPNTGLFTTLQWQVSFDIEYFKSSAVKFSLLSAAAYAALSPKDPDTLYGII